MKVLWFEVTVPGNFRSKSFHGGGWQDSLEKIVRGKNDIELGIAFESEIITDQACVRDGVSYFPLTPSYNVMEKFDNKKSVKTSANHLLELSKKIIEDFKPDLIHVFGSEWCFGQVAKFATVPVIIHMQGSIPAYNNAWYPPGYSKWDEIAFCIKKMKLKNLMNLPLGWMKQDSWREQEEETLRLVRNYMGRTDWDRNMVSLFHPECAYYYCGEALRSEFTECTNRWKIPKSGKLILSTVGCSSLWKGLDTIIRTAKILKKRGIDFEWWIFGGFHHQKFLEWKEDVKLIDIGINLRGAFGAEKLRDELLKTSIYVHPAYIDNSPNALCEAQYLGIPVIATNVGGIPSLVEHMKNGILVAANDPYSIAKYAIELSKDVELATRIGNDAQATAMMRHDTELIYSDLLGIYRGLLAKAENRSIEDA